MSGSVDLLMSFSWASSKEYIHLSALQPATSFERKAFLSNIWVISSAMQCNLFSVVAGRRVTKSQAHLMYFLLNLLLSKYGSFSSVSEFSWQTPVHWILQVHEQVVITLRFSLDMRTYSLAVSRFVARPLSRWDVLRMLCVRELDDCVLFSLRLLAASFLTSCSFLSCIILSLISGSSQMAVI